MSVTSNNPAHGSLGEGLKALHDKWGWIGALGIILMIAGALGLLWTLLIWGPRQRGSTVVEERRPVERRVYDDQPPV